jgi:hypothetical protein
MCTDNDENIAVVQWVVEAFLQLDDSYGWNAVSVRSRAAIGLLFLSRVC